jgi:hypothetical protein
MALYTFATAMTEIQYRLGGRGDIVTGTPSRVNRWLNSACIILAEADTDIPELEVRSTEVTVVAQAEYVLNASGSGGFNILNLLGIRYLRNTTTGQLLEWMPWREYRELHSQASGSPVRWSRNGNLLAVDPTPAAIESLLVEYRRYPTEDSLVDFTDRYHEDLVSLGTYIGWIALRQYDEAVKVKMMLPQYLQLRLAIPMNQYDWEAASGTKARMIPYER